MANYIHRATLVEALTTAGVAFAEDATVADLRPMYDELMDRAAHVPLGDGAAAIIQQQQQQPQAAAIGAELQQQQQQQQAAAIEGELQQLQQQQQPQQAELDAEHARLDRELDLARKRHELQRLMDELREHDGRRFDFAAFEGMVPKFSGDDHHDIRK